MRKANISVQTFFFIIMSLFMVWIIVFGFNKLFVVQDHLSEQNRILFKKDLSNALDYCNDPLNKGSYKLVEFKNKVFNSLCIINSTNVNSGNSKLDADLRTFQQTLNNSYGVVLLKTKINDKGKLLDYNIIDSFNIENFNSVFCSFDKENTGILHLKIDCK